jgi:hypothetical protein
MAKIKKTKSQRIEELERKLFESEAAQIHQHHFASVQLDKLVTDKMMGSGVIMTLTTLGGRLTIGPVMISNGLSKETIEAIKADLVRSYNYSIELKPLGAKHDS